MDDPAAIARGSGFALSTVDVAAFEVCFDLYGEDRLLATFLYDGKPQNAFVDDPATATDDPVGWCIQHSDELSQSDRVVRPFRCPEVQLDLATALACGMVQQRLHATGWWEPLPGHRLWDESNTARVLDHQRIEIDDP